MENKFRVILLFFLSLQLVSCSKPAGKNSVELILKETAEPLFLDHYLSGQLLSSNFQNFSPSLTSDFNCFAVNITGPSMQPINPVAGVCNSPNNFQGKGLGLLTRPSPKNQTIEVDIPSGKDRSIDVYGIFPPLPECGGTPGAGVSGYFLGGRRLDILEPTSIVIPVSYVTGTAASLMCNGGPGSVTPSMDFGNGADGDVTITGNSADLIVTTVPGYPSRKFNAARKVISIDTATSRVVGLNSAFAADEFTVGDEVMLIVMAQNTPTTCSSTVTDFFRGKWMTARIDSIAGNNLTLNAPLANNPANINNGNVNSASCQIQIIRVPNFRNLTTTTGAITLSVPAYSDTTSIGGVIAFRVQESLTMNVNLTLDVPGKGFPGGAATSNGKGVEANGARLLGGGGGAFGGGGGSTNAGGTANSAAIPGGGPFSCAGPFEEACMYHGGGGGGATGEVGGAGGGIVFVHSKFITNAGGSLSVNANGGSGAGGTGSGGGAGGTVFIKTKVSDNTAIGLNAAGMSGTATNSGGGAGGRMFVHYCSGNNPATNTAAGGSGGGSGAPGSAGTQTIVVNPAAPFCSL